MTAPLTKRSPLPGSNSATESIDAPGSAQKGYYRPMSGWWKRNLFFKIYMAREFTALGVLAYAVVLAVAAYRLSQGPAQWQEFVDMLQSPLSLVFHLVVLACMLIHAHSWFVIMPKTMPMLFIGSRRIGSATITRAGWIVAAFATITLVALAAWAGTSR